VRTSGGPERLKPNRGDNLETLLESAALSAHRDVLAYLLDLGADPNNGADGGSTALEACLRRLGRMAFYAARGHYTGADIARRQVSTARDAVKLLLQRGAVWKPNAATLKATRRVLCHLEPEDAARLIGHAMKGEGGEEAARELLRVPRVRQHLAPCYQELSRLGLMRSGRSRRTDHRPRCLGAPGGPQAKRPMG
jgi:hypothetical protein